MSNPLRDHLPPYVLIDGAEIAAAGPRYRAYAAVLAEVARRARYCLPHPESGS